jgi:outer membrane protein assembly factor BamE (lipoprotein component of BamABCDE complex)
MRRHEREVLEMPINKFLKHCLIVTLLVASGCASASQHRSLARGDETDRLTVGKVQREIKVGMSSAQVIEILGSPNIVSTDEERREVWVYDKISTEVAYSASESAGTLILIGGSGASGAKSTSQRTLTRIVKFDNEGKVRDFAYHTSSF